MLAAAVASCTKETTPERINIQHPDQQSPILRDNAYYQNLRAYKQTKHKLAFGWYGSWTAVGASYQSRLISAPDSMDIISIWSQWHTLTPQQKADKEFVQKTLGTKVTYTIFSDKLPEPFLEIGNGEYTDEAIEAYAKAYCKDSMDKYQYDGIDIDYEPGYGASGPFVGHDNALFTKLINAMSKYVGPKSGTGRLLIIDGVPYAVDRSVVDCFDYGIVQAYASSGYTDLQNRFNNADAKGWKPEQYIFAENFESYWKTGGVDFTDREGNRMPSLYGMATFNPTQGAGAGFGAYHMEYEYGNSAMPYQFMRNAIQMANPAGGWKTPIDVAFSSNQSSNFSFVVEDDGSVTGTMQDKVSLSFSRPVVSGMQLTLGVDNSLVAVYNDKNGTEYETVDPSLVKMGPIQCAENQVFSPDATITLDPKSIEKGYYLIPVVISPISDAGYAVKEGSVHYIFVTKVAMDVEIGATTLDGSKIAPTSAWTITCCQGTATSGATGVWNCDSAAQKAAMFDGKLDGNCWYASSASYSWGNGGNFTIDMGEVNDVTGLRWHIHYQDSEPQCTDLTYSEDGNVWYSLSAGVPFTPVLSDNWKWVKFKRTVKARYIRVYVGLVTGWTSMNEAEIYGPAN